MTRPVAFVTRAIHFGLVAVAASCLAFVLYAQQVVAGEAPARANDPMYGWVLYNYYQGATFDALTLLDVARERGGVSGHGAYPELVEGGLMLSYGMPREARELFIRLLEGTSASDGDGPSPISLAPDVRSQAWFYLGKVFYLEGNYHLAYENLQRVDADVLEESDSELYAEWLYLRAQLAMTSGTFNEKAGGGALIASLAERLKGADPWAHYLSYNMAMAEITAGKFPEAQQSLRVLIAGMQDEPPREDLASEYSALLDKSRLSLARLYLREAKFDEALRLLQTMPLDGVFSDRALYDYAVAAAGQGQMQRALGALDALSQRVLFLAWREQVPYARGYVLELMNQPRRALNAFEQAVEHYEIRREGLNTTRQALTEDNLMASLSFLRDGDELNTDAYGRLRVTPTDFGLSELLATEPFQQALAQLHELYQMHALLMQREDQLSTFETMLETRLIQREHRSSETRFELEQQQVGDWASAHERFRAEIQAALTREDAAFFMTTEQKALKAQLDSVSATLAQLPNDKSTGSQRQTYQRMKAYFDWTVANNYGVNRWAAQKELRELDREMAQFRNQRAAIETLEAGDNQHGELADRLARNATELQELKAQVQDALAQARNILMGQLDKALEQQSRELRRYLVASLHARARLTDQLFQAARSSEASNE